MNAMASQISSVLIVCSTVCSGTDQRKHQSSASVALLRRIHRSPVDSSHKGPVMCKMFPFDDIIMFCTKVGYCGIWDSCIVGFARLDYCVQVESWSIHWVHSIRPTIRVLTISHHIIGDVDLRKPCQFPVSWRLVSLSMQIFYLCHRY